MRNAHLYRICTEDVNGEQTREIVSRHFDGFTLLRGDGVWKGGSEKALVIEIMGKGDPGEHAAVALLCEDLKEANVQDSVLVEVLAATNYLI